jgi:TolB protein
LTTGRALAVWSRFGRGSLVALMASLSLSTAIVVGRDSDTPNVVRLTSDGGFKEHLQWSPDGKRFLLTCIHEGHMGLWTMNVDGTDLRRLVTPEPNTVQFDGHWSSDGKRIAYVHDVLQGTDGKLQINTCATDGTDIKVLIPHAAFEESPRWSPDGSRLAWVSTRDGNQEVYVASADGKDLKRLTNEIAPDNNPSWSPDSKHIAFTSARSGNLEIHIMDPAGGNVRRLTNHPSIDCWPAWSPDGKRIAFTSNREGNYDIYLINIDGSGLRNLTRNPAQDNFATWSPDGKRIAFISTRAGGSDIYVIDVGP